MAYQITRRDMLKGTAATVAAGALAGTSLFDGVASASLATSPSSRRSRK